MKIGIIGIGNVGLQVLKDIQSNDKINKFLNVEKILVRDKDKYLNILESEFGVDSPVLEKLTDDFNNFINSDIDTVVELIGGSNPAKEYVKEALNYKKNVVTANKEIIASSIEDLTSSAILNKVKIRFEAAVGAGIPLIEVLIDMLKQNKIEVLGLLSLSIWTMRMKLSIIWMTVRCLVELYRKFKTLKSWPKKCKSFA